MAAETPSKQVILIADDSAMNRAILADMLLDDYEVVEACRRTRGKVRSMAAETPSKQVILIADDSAMNRAILADMLLDDYEVVEACDGEEAIEVLRRRGTDIDLVLLDIVMPGMDGFDVLAMMNHQKWIQDIPVIMITAETAGAYTKRAYELGATDFINRPFDPQVVHRRITNTIMLYSNQKALTEAVAHQILSREKDSGLMVAALSHIVEFRSGEGGLHIMRVNSLTEILLRHLAARTDQYGLTPADISTITLASVEFRSGEGGLHIMRVNSLTEILLRHLAARTDQYGLTPADISTITLASSLHDIGTIKLSEELVTKRERLTDEEFELYKGHALAGARLLEELPYTDDDTKLQRFANQICRWHHERWDGSGYPDGLVGDETPIAAQVVGLADAYDSLTNDRRNPNAYSHELAMDLITGGVKGPFNPLLIECLVLAEREVAEAMATKSLGEGRRSVESAQHVLDEIRQYDNPRAMHAYSLLEDERAKCRFVESLLGGISFEYDATANTLMLTEQSARMLGLPTFMVDPLNDERLIARGGLEPLNDFKRMLQAATPEHPEVSGTLAVKLGAAPRDYQVNCLTLWRRQENELRYTAIMGEMREQRRSYTPENYSRSDVFEALKESAEPQGRPVYTALVVAVDNYEEYRDTYGRLAGDACLGKIAAMLNDFGAPLGLRFCRLGTDRLLGLSYTPDQPAQELAQRVAEAVADLAIPHAGSPTGQLSVSVLGTDRLLGLSYTPDQPAQELAQRVAEAVADLAIPHAGSPTGQLSVSVTCG